ncbi:MAG: hydrogenase maturation protease [Promethearchaeota archaeon]
MLEFFSFLKAAKKGKLSIFCVGNDLRGDDGLGPMIYHKLRMERNNKFLIYNVGGSLENFLSVLLKENVTHCLIIDAVQFGNNEIPAGTIGFFKPSDLENKQATLSTHLIPMKVLVDYMKNQSGVLIRILGIKPKNLDFGSEISFEVLNAIDKIIDFLVSLLGEQNAKLLKEN